MKLADVERHRHQQGCVLLRQGGKHTVWLNPQARKISSLPRHRDIKEGTVHAICKQLEILQP